MWQVYFARARVYLPAIISFQNLTTVQALLCVVQYYFRASVRQSHSIFVKHFLTWLEWISNMVCRIIRHWRFQSTYQCARDLVGVVLRLCIKLRYHRKSSGLSEDQRLDPYTIELQKRFFWCAYCFDRFVPQILLAIHAWCASLIPTPRLISMLSKLPFGISDSDIDIEVCSRLPFWDWAITANSIWDTRWYRRHLYRSAEDSRTSNEASS